jgi:exodeoxyribonuclease VII small subunit
MSETNEVKTSATIGEKSVAELPFEEAIARLEVIVKTMEGDAVSLDESLALYEEGVALVRRLTRELDEAEQRVQILQKTPDGEIKPAPFASTED